MGTRLLIRFRGYWQHGIDTDSIRSCQSYIGTYTNNVDCSCSLQYPNESELLVSSGLDVAAESYIRILYVCIFTRRETRTPEMIIKESRHVAIPDLDVLCISSLSACSQI